MAKKFNRQLKGDDFDSRYEVVQNHLVINACYEGAWFETYGVEQDFIYSIGAERVWTIVEEDGVLWRIAGRHYVNRLGYLLTTKGWSDENEAYLFA